VSRDIVCGGGGGLGGVLFGGTTKGYVKMGVEMSFSFGSK